MALDVRLSRDVDEPWGFELYGGADNEMPLTIEKIQPESAAKRAGLLNGDTILTINGEEAIDLSHEAACRKIEESGHSLTVGVLRGLYDPVLDDQEPIYEYEPDDLGLQSEPTEVVFKIQQFEPADLGSNLLDLGTEPGTNIPLAEPRSLTASPFVTPTKPYRPFSTEPVSEVPDLEDPIILNPDYHDQFGKSPVDADPDYILNAHNGIAIESRFKLPISEQYDPDGTRFKQNVEVVEKLLKYEKHVKSLSKDLSVVDVTKETKVTETAIKDKVEESFSKDVNDKKTVKICEEISQHEDVTKESQTMEKKEIVREELEEESIREELKSIEKMRQEIDLEKIEETAVSIVEDSIERAVSVAEEIKKEVEVELSTSEVEFKSEKVVSKSEQQDISESIKSEVSEQSSEINERSESQFKKENIEYSETKMNQQKSEQQEISEKIFKKDVEISETSEKVSKIDEAAAVEKKSILTEEHQHEEGPRRKESHVTFEGMAENKGEFKKVTRTVTAGAKTDKSGAEHRAYTIGLQTIPNIRGVVHSSYHYDLLLRTFFIHLTDVMVALSRFVLTQPIFNQLEETTRHVNETQTYEKTDVNIKKTSQEFAEKVETAQQDKKVVENKQPTRQLVTPVPVVEKKQEIKAVSQKVETGMKVEEKKVEKKEIVKPVAVKQEVKVEKMQEQKAEQAVKEMSVEKKTVSGAEMAQRTEKKLTQEMTKKLDAVISEFQTVAVEDDKKEMLQRNRRSRSRSQIEEEVMKESDPLEWLSKVDSTRTSQEKTEISKKEFSSSEAVEKRSIVESKQETKHRRSKTPKQTYVAIVESHVYTNKDAIFEEAADISETSSVQSAEEINTAVETIEMVSSENVAIESAMKELETAKIVEETHELATVTAKNAATVQKVEEVMHDSKELNVTLESAVRELETAKIVEQTHKLATATAKSAATVQKIEEVMHDSKQIVHEEYKKETAIQSSVIQEVLIQEIKDIVEPVIEIKDTKLETEQVSININESHSIAESTEISAHETKSEFSSVEIKEETATALIEEKQATVIAESAATVQTIEEIVHDSKEFVHKEIKTETAIQSSNIQEVLVQETREIVEPVVEMKTTKIDKVEKVAVDINESLAVAESTEISIQESKSDFSKVEMKKESVALVEEEKIDDKRIESEVEVIQPEPEIIEITETVKVKPKTVHDEFAALKIVKRVETEGNLSPEIIEVQDISELISKSVVNKVGVGNQVTIDAFNEFTDKTLMSRNSSAITQESSFTAKSVDKKLSLRTDLGNQASIQSPPSTINTPTPSTVPPTPLTEEYVFKLALPLPKSRSGTPVPRDGTLSPEDEDPHIVKKKLVPHIETTIESVVYETPLASPPPENPESPVYNKPVLNGGSVKTPVYYKPGLKGGAIKVRYPVYRKPGLFGGADNPDYSKEEIREIERKSSLLASAIDETIKSIEEYKEEVGIETKKEVKFQEFTEERTFESHQESYSKTKEVENGFEDIDTKIEEIMEQCQALASFNNAKERHNSLRDPNSEGIVTEYDDDEINETDFKSDHERRVKFENEIKIVTVEQIDVNNDEIDTAESEQDSQTEQNIIEAVIVDNHDAETRNVSEVVVENKVGMETTEKVEVSRTVEPVAENVEQKTEKPDPLLGFRSVVFDPENIQKRSSQYPMSQESMGSQDPRHTPYMTETGELIGTIQGIVDGLEDPVMDAEVAKELGKPGISEEKIATLISGEAEMLREAHVMGVDFQRIKPMIDSLKDSEVLKALNEELARKRAEEKKKEEKKWTTFLQKPKRPVPKVKFGYHGWTEEEQNVAEPYKVKIVKQAKPKVAPDYKPEDFETGPLPWEQRAEVESSLPPVEPEDPILIPEVPEFFEAVDPLKESEVPDLEDTGIPLPPPKEPTPPPVTEEQAPESEPEPEPEVQEEAEVEAEEKQEAREDMDNRLAEQLVRSVQGMVDPNASLDQQLAQMRAQLAALAQLPEVIQQSLEIVSKQLSRMTQQEAQMELSATHTESQNCQQLEVIQNHNGLEMQTIQEDNENNTETQEVVQKEDNTMIIEEVQDSLEMGQNVLEQNHVEQNMREEMTMAPVMTEEDLRLEKQKKEQARLEHESRLVKQHPTPRAAKPKKVFGPLDPDEARAVVLPGGRRWRKTEDVYNEQMFAETLQAQAELIQGKAMGFESDLLPFDNRINFMKYEKPPVSLDHLKHSEVYKLVHDMDQMPLKRVEMRTPVISEADYRERCRSMTPCAEKKHVQIPQQFHP